MRPQFLSQPFSEMADCGIVDAWGPVLRGDLDSFALLHGPGRSSSIPVQTFQEKPTVALYTLITRPQTPTFLGQRLEARFA